MTDADKLVMVLEKTRKSIGNFACYYNPKTKKCTFNGPHTMRGYDLRDRYDDAKSALRKIDLAAWEAYCDKHGSDYSHEAIDFWA